eukprot:5351850-Pleurochrysis_carterae.AAC.1
MKESAGHTAACVAVVRTRASSARSMRVEACARAFMMWCSRACACACARACSYACGCACARLEECDVGLVGGDVRLVALEDPLDQLRDEGRRPVEPKQAPAAHARARNDTCVRACVRACARASQCGRRHRCACSTVRSCTRSRKV